MKYIRWFKALPFPLMVALIVVVLTVSIVAASFISSRSVHIVTDVPFSVEPETSLNLQLWQDVPMEVNYLITNKADKQISVETTQGLTDPAIEVTIDPAVLVLPVGASENVTITILPVESCDNCTVSFDFKVL